MRNDDKIIANWIAPNSRVLDLGCGNGALLYHLKHEKNVLGYGIEINPQAILECTKKGLNVIQKDIDHGMDGFLDQSFDHVIMGQSLQTMRNTDKVLLEMLRVGREGIISFPNMGHIRIRAQLALGGHMPVTKTIAHTWYQTPNIHLCTIKDFENLCDELGVEILEKQLVGDKHEIAGPMTQWLPNLLGKIALYRVKKRP